MTTHSSRAQKGQQSEDIAANYLQNLGYQILHRRYRWRHGEIDLIATEGTVLCFVEVRSKQNALYGRAIETINWQKQLHLLQTAQHFLTHAWHDSVPACRFDVITLEDPGPYIFLLRDAFQPSAV